MSVVPVGESIASGYRFLGLRLVRVVGLNWLPTVFLALCGAWLIGHLASPPAALSGAAAALWPAADSLALVIATAFFGAAIGVPLVQEAFGFHDEAVAVHFVFGRREFRLFLAFLRLAALLIVTTAAVATVVSLILWLGLPMLFERLPQGAASAWHGVPLLSVVAAGTLLVAASVAIFLWVRFGFLLTAIAALEEKASLRRAWALSRNSFWRGVLIAAAVVLPVDLLARGAELLLYGPELVRGGDGSSMQAATALIAWFVAHSTAFAWIGAVTLALVSTLLAGAIEPAYRARSAATETDGQMPAPTRVEPAPAFVPAMAAPPLDTLGNRAGRASPDDAQAPAVELRSDRDTIASETAAHAVDVTHDRNSAPVNVPVANEALHGPEHAALVATPTPDETVAEEELPLADPVPETSLEEVPPQQGDGEHVAKDEQKVLETVG